MLGGLGPRSAAELDGVAELARLHEKELALGVLVGNEGITFKRYEPEDLTIAAGRLRKTPTRPHPDLDQRAPGGLSKPALLGFGDFLAPNIHPGLRPPGARPR